MRDLLPFAGLALLGVAAAACDPAEPPKHLRIAGADAQRGHEAIQRFGCGACHRIPGVPGAVGLVGPPLERFADRALIAGQLPNRPAVLVAFLQDPPALVPATGMPEMGVGPSDARDMAAYLYSLDAGETIVWPPDVPLDRPLQDGPHRPD